MKPEPLCLCGHGRDTHWWTDDSCKTCACQRYEADEPTCEHPNQHATGAAFSSADGKVFFYCPDCKAKWAAPEPDDRLQRALRAASEMKEALPSARRPPYAVTYATRSRDFQVLTPGDCSVSVVDGALVIRHIEPVTGVTAVQPYYPKEG